MEHYATYVKRQYYLSSTLAEQAESGRKVLAARIPRLHRELAPMRIFGGCDAVLTEYIIPAGKPYLARFFVFASNN